MTPEDRDGANTVGGEIVDVAALEDFEVMAGLPKVLQDLQKDLPLKFVASEFVRIWEEAKAKNPLIPQTMLASWLAGELAKWAHEEYQSTLEDANRQYDVKVMKRLEDGEEAVKKSVRPEKRLRADQIVNAVRKRAAADKKRESWEYDPYRIHTK
jgi:hypothetical protein